MSITRLYVYIIFKLAIKDLEELLLGCLLKKYFYCSIYLIDSIYLKNPQKPGNDEENKIIMTTHEVQQEHKVCCIEGYACNFFTETVLGFY